MKILIATLMLISSSMAFACPNLTGTYRDNEGETTQFIQSGCSSIKIVAQGLPAIEVIADGVMREVYNGTMNEGGVEVKIETSIQATFTATELLINNIGRAVQNGEVTNMKTHSVVTLLSNGDMKTVMTDDNDGSVTTFIETKIN